ncbi:hypothetical protein BDV29DRAFT_171770 [Aspergillus leporis]|uniref:Uncharacterized protein n=1 Tax=Aspergillus leporis TaxID=41062 RepID=A0A5N5X8H5_9EURO|nr:hypothetical protein BDV29DRAFT_171770 [Aspergillus leporis]
MSLQRETQESSQYPLPNNPLSATPKRQSPCEHCKDHRGSGATESGISHYLHFEDNDCFFPPSELGRRPPSQRDGPDRKRSSMN